MCWRCDKKNYDNHSYDKEMSLTLVDETYTGLYMCINEYDNWCLEASGDDTVKIKINYCPFCGRELKEDEDNE